MPQELYRDFLFPLNVFMHVLTHEEGGVKYLHYGIFENENESIAAAQERSTSMLLERLPEPPARILEAGIGLATTLVRLLSLQYDAFGITPDEKQIAMVHVRHGAAIPVECVAFENFEPRAPFDCVVFQESSQYIDSNALWRKAAELTNHVIVVDEFKVRPAEAPLHELQPFLDAAAANGFEKIEDIDLSSKAAPTVAYFMKRLPRYRDRLIADIGVTSEQLDDLLRSGESYQDLYRNGVYSYRLMQFKRRR